MGAGGQRDCAQCPAALYPGGWRREECSRWGLKEPPLEQSPQHGRCISSFLSSYLPAPYTASLNKFAYFYAMSSRHQKEQAAPSPSSLPFPAPPLYGPTGIQQASRFLCGRVRGQGLLKESSTHKDTSLTFPVLGRTNVGCLVVQADRRPRRLFYNSCTN